MKRVIIILLLAVLSVNAQPPARFYATYGGEGDDIGYSAKVTLDGKYIIAGSTSSFGNSNTDVYLAKINEMGNGVWHQHHGGIGNDVAKAVIQLPDSGYVIAGYTDSYGAGGFDVYILKTDKNGNFIWQQTWGGKDWEFGNDLVLAADGTIMVVGFTYSFGAGKKDGFVIKYDQTGKYLGERMIGGAENEELRSVINTSDGNIVTVGYTESRGDLNGDMYFLKLDKNGDTIFTKTIGGAYKDFANDVVQKIDDTFVICGAKTFTANTFSQSYMYSINSNGGFVWENNYYHSSNNEALMSVTNSSYTPSLSAFVRNVPVPQLNMQGNIIVTLFGGWNHLVNSFGGGDEETFYSIEGTPDGGFLVVGSTLSFGSLAQDVFLMKHDSTCFNYTSIVGLRNADVREEEVVLSYLSGKNISVEITDYIGGMDIIVSNLQGKTLLEKKSETNSAVISVSDLPSSVYFIKISYNKGTVVKKFLIQ